MGRCGSVQRSSSRGQTYSRTECHKISILRVDCSRGLRNCGSISRWRSETSVSPIMQCKVHAWNQHNIVVVNLWEHHLACGGTPFFRVKLRSCTNVVILVVCTCTSAWSIYTFCCCYWTTRPIGRFCCFCSRLQWRPNVQRRISRNRFVFIYCACTDSLATHLAFWEASWNIRSKLAERSVHVEDCV